MPLNSSPELDAKDWSILEALQLEARQSLSALGKRIGLSQPAISERIRKLEDAGIIEGYGARLNLQKLGVGLQAIVRLRTTHQHIASSVKQFESMPEVLEVHRVTGEDCFVIRCAFAEPSDLERIVDHLARYGSVTTMLVLSKPVAKHVARNIVRQTK
jgi:Lrp/AsnC family transcriptional regulator, leucine-responsive regulatory protein